MMLSDRLKEIITNHYIYKIEVKKFTCKKKGVNMMHGIHYTKLLIMSAM